MARVLVIEDQPSIGMVFNLALSDEGHLVDIVRDGYAGLKRLNQEPKIEVVIVDLIMPGLSGKDVVEVMFADPRLRGIPVVIISGCIPKPEILPPEGSYRAFINKPFDLTDVIDTVHRLTSAHVVFPH